MDSAWDMADFFYLCKVLLSIAGVVAAMWVVAWFLGYFAVGWHEMHLPRCRECGMEMRRPKSAGENQQCEHCGTWQFEFTCRKCGREMQEPLAAGNNPRCNHCGSLQIESAGGSSTR